MKHKKRTKKRSFPKFMKGNILIPLLFVVIAFGVLLTSGSLVNKSATDPKEQFGEATVASGSGQKNLQLKDLTFSKKPTPATDSCNHDMNKKADPETCQCIALLFRCANNKCAEIDQKKSISAFANYTCSQVDQYNWCTTFGSEGDGWYCVGKPVIYLYPEKPTLVNVTVKTAGKIVISDPLYSNEGWQNVLAHPDGTLLYQGQKYRELFYETQTQNVERPHAGLVFASANIEKKLTEFIIKLGLVRKDEQREFLDFWVPKLKALNSSYIFVSILERDEKERLDSVAISPKPDTFIDFIVYFSPSKTSENPNPLVLPPTPQRIGFTAIEWGGVIGK